MLNVCPWCSPWCPQAWEAEGTALLLTERLMNTPPQIAPPLMQAIFDEIEWATEDEPTQATPPPPPLLTQLRVCLAGTVLACRRVCGDMVPTKGFPAGLLVPPPPPLSPPLPSDGCPRKPQELRDSYKLKQYIVATRVYVDPEAPAPSEVSGSSGQVGGVPCRGMTELPGPHPSLCTFHGVVWVDAPCPTTALHTGHRPVPKVDT